MCVSNFSNFRRRPIIAGQSRSWSTSTTHKIGELRASQHEQGNAQACGNERNYYDACRRLSTLFYRATLAAMIFSSLRQN